MTGAVIVLAGSLLVIPLIRLIGWILPEPPDTPPPDPDAELADPEETIKNAGRDIAYALSGLWLICGWRQ